MAFSGPIVPNMIVVRFVMDNFWSVGRLETYITGYQPGGIPLAILRRTLGHHFLPPPLYARNLSRLAALLFGIGHAKSVKEVLLDLFLRIPPGHLTPDQVGPPDGMGS
jgi:hypothetical protein